MKRSVFTLFGVVAVLLTAAVALMLSGATLSGGNGNLKCYDLKGSMAKCSVSAMRD